MSDVDVEGHFRCVLLHSLKAQSLNKNGFQAWTAVALRRDETFGNEEARPCDSRFDHSHDLMSNKGSATCG